MTNSEDMDRYVNAVERHRTKNHEEHLRDIRLTLSDNTDALRELADILNEIEHSTQAYKASREKKATIENDSTLDEKDKVSRLGSIRTRQGFIDNFFDRSRGDLSRFLRKHQVEYADKLAAIIVNGYRESVGAPPLSTNGKIRLG